MKMPSWFFNRGIVKKEIWKPLKIYNGEYAVSSFGRVMSLKRGKKTILKTAKSTGGYLKVNLYFEKKQHTKTVHRLVAIGFNVIRNGLEINHIDGNKLNNYLKNLEACTKSHNLSHRFKIGISSHNGELNPAAKINMKIANEIRREVSCGKTHLFISRKYDLSGMQVRNIINNKCWRVTP